MSADKESADKELLVFVDPHFPPAKELTKTYDENGWERWDFTVATSYGRIICSFYPQQTETTLYRFFAGKDAQLTDVRELEAIDAKSPGKLYAQVEYALGQMESLLPKILQESAVLSGQKAIHETLWGPLNGKAHRLPASALVGTTMDQVRDTAKRMVMLETNNKPGRKNHLPNAELRNAYLGIKDAWQHANKVYKSSREFDNWKTTVRNDVRKKYKIDLPPRLVALLNSLDDSCPENFTPTPGNLALEHAARLCGTKPWAHPSSTLHDKVKRASASSVTNGNGLLRKSNTPPKRRK
jgi:hypothetical protein